MQPIRQDRSAVSVRERILQLFYPAGPYIQVTGAVICERLDGCFRANVMDALDALVKAGELTRKGRGDGAVYKRAEKRVGMRWSDA